jgi:hypothetical protein
LDRVAQLILCNRVAQLTCRDRVAKLILWDWVAQQTRRDTVTKLILWVGWPTYQAGAGWPS